MTTEEAIRTQAARGDLSPRRTIRRALDSMDAGKDAIISALLYSYGATDPNAEPVSKLTIEYAAQQARLAADLLQALAERVK